MADQSFDQTRSEAFAGRMMDVLNGAGITLMTSIGHQVGLFDAMADWMAVPLIQHEGGQPPKRIGLAHTSIAPYGVFRSKDGVRSRACVGAQDFFEARLQRPTLNNIALT